MTALAVHTDPAALAEVLAVTAEHAAAADAGARFPVEALAALRTSGLLGLTVPREHGGAGGGVTELVDVTLRLARVDMSVGLIFAMHGQQVVTLARHADAALRADVLPAVARGELYLASVTTERGTRGDLLSSDSTVESLGDLLAIDRDAPVVTGGRHADAFLITVQPPRARTRDQVSLVFARRDQLTAEVHGEWRPLGMRATESVPMRLTGAVPPEQVIGPAGGFRSLVAETFGPLAHLGWAATWLGAAAGAFARVVEHIRSPAGRRQFNPASELLLARLARIRGRLDLVHGLLRHAITVFDRGTTSTSSQLQMNALKIHAAEHCFAAIDELVELAGLRHGYMTDSALFVERVFRDLRSASLNFANDRLYLANGALALLDRQVTLV